MHCNGPWWRGRPHGNRAVKKKIHVDDRIMKTKDKERWIKDTMGYHRPEHSSRMSRKTKSEIEKKRGSLPRSQ